MVESREEQAGAFSNFTAAGIGEVPMYLVSFDKDGKCTSPKTRQRVLADASSGRHSDVHVYSHGWNNVFKEALAHYTEFFTEYFALRAAAGVGNGSYKPMVVGIIWPSTAFLTDDEVGPALAGDSAAAAFDAALDEVKGELGPVQGQRLAELAKARQPLGPEASVEMANLLLPLFARGEGQGGQDAAADVSAADLLRNWGRPAAAAGARRGQAAPLPDADASASPEAAGLLEFLNPREILRKATVFLMKDRAGIVGRGVGDLVGDLLRASTATHVHLTGHSFGAKVMLSALASLHGERQVASTLLLQPAVNAYCFAEHVGRPDGPPGAYRAALSNVALPVHTTFSGHDRALSDFFGLALRRHADEGELEGAPMEDRFGALGGIGPRGLPAGEVVTLGMLERPERYPRPVPGVRIVALDGTVKGITSHGDVRNTFTEWVMVNLVEARP